MFFLPVGANIYRFYFRSTKDVAKPKLQALELACFNIPSICKASCFSKVSLKLSSGVVCESSSVRFHHEGRQRHQFSRESGGGGGGASW